MRKLLFSACIFIVISVITACNAPSFHQVSAEVRKAMSEQRYADAIAASEKSRYYRKSQHKLLYNLEMGKLYHLSGDYLKSNTFLNEADLYFDEWSHLRVLDIQGNYKIGNDQKESGHISSFFTGFSNDYHPEDHEKILIHYYKALNYLSLNNPDEAIVEARKLDQLLYNLSTKDLFSDHSQILNDPFAQILIGLIYESGYRMNDAFIAYRQAGKMYTPQETPVFLKHSILRSAYLARLDDEVELYEHLFSMKADSIAKLYTRNMVVFWENGMAPLKEVQYVIVAPGGYKSLAPPFYTVTEESRGSFIADLLFGYRKVNKPIPGKLIGIPKYVSTDSYYNRCSISTGNSNPSLYEPLIIENIETHTTKFINERSMNEVDAYGSGAPDTVQVSYGRMPDLRTWQSLPATISLCRVPLAKPDTSVTVLFLNNKNEADTLNLAVDPKQAFTLRNMITYR